MQTTIHQPAYLNPAAARNSNLSVWRKFIRWADGQEKNRFGWTAGILTGHGCVVTILTMVFIMLSGNNFFFWPFAIAGMATCVITNLAALPTRITIPVFLGSLLVDLLIIAICIANGLSMNATYI